MRNPLRHRYVRELRDDFGKYVVIFLLLIISISFVSGILVAQDSMIAAYNKGFETYNIEDGSFSVESRLSEGKITKLERENALSIYEKFYIERELDNGSKLRIYKDRDEVDLVCLMKGEMPDQSGEIALDRMYAVNNGISIGDTVSDGDTTWTVTGYVALTDYSCLFENNSDMMFDSLAFGVAVVSDEEFAAYDKNELCYQYAWLYDEELTDEAQEADFGEDFMEALAKLSVIEDFVPEYMNRAIIFTGDDLGGDRVMMEVFLYIIIVILAFVFAVTISNTVSKEATVIGTLRAMGYTKAELIRHYMVVPVLVTLISAVIGNVLGYTVLKELGVYMYYNSYSLTTYTTLWNARVFFETTVVPILIMLFINYFVLRTKLSFPVMKLMRRDLKRRRMKHAFPLNRHIPFFTRFRIRVIAQNITNYLVLLVGILFANFMLMFGLMLPSILDHYADNIEDSMLCDYQYILQMPATAANTDNDMVGMISLFYFLSEVQTDNPDAEKFSAYSLSTLGEGKYLQEEISFYGVIEDSEYVDLDLDEDDVVISSAYADKYQLEVGDEITLKEEYEVTEYTFTITGIYDYSASLCVFMDIDALNERFRLGDGTFTGYFSNSEITDIDESYIGTVIDIDAMTKVTRQLQHSFGTMMYLLDIFSVLMYMVLIYLLSKVIIEKNAQSISMAKILGYKNGEISGLYIVPTSILVVLFVVLSLPLMELLLGALAQIMFSMMSGWFAFFMDTAVKLKTVGLGIGSYAVVALFEYRKVKNVPMEEALKNME